MHVDFARLGIYVGSKVCVPLTPARCLLGQYISAILRKISVVYFTL
jgi:hypothetical protein